MEMESVQLPFGQPLTEQYVKRTNPKVEGIFGSHPIDDKAWTNRLNQLKAHETRRIPADRLAVMLERYNTRFNANSSVMINIAAIAKGASVVVGGQQAGLWTGPLLVIHKAVTILAAAREASRLTGETVVPVFWIAGEDHDWDEANHAFVYDEENEIRKIAVDRPSGSRTSVSRTEVTSAALDALIKELKESLPDTAFKPELIRKMAAFGEQSRSMTDLFALMMGWMFGEQGLVLLDSDDPALRELEAPMFRRMIERNDELEQAYLAGVETVSGLGFAPQADAQEGCANIFLFMDVPEGEEDTGNPERTLLYKRGGRFENRKGTFSCSREELLSIADETPDRLSNNVLTRPLMQDYVLPVLAAVLGAGEIAYWAVTAPAFSLLDMQMPVILPRMSFTLMEGAVSKHMLKFDLTLEDVAFRFTERKNTWLKEQDHIDIDSRFEEAKRYFAEMYDPLLDTIGSIEPGLTVLGEDNKRRINEQIEYLEKRTKEAHARRFETVTRQLDRIAGSLWPDGQPQERVVNALVYWNLYGRSWLERLLELPLDRSGGHRIIYI
ncbi:bacillithiol biosynthesis cysteine-adding enzyme BshC [Paenibacillus nasutitermitis]|uniref:Putative cysteine ligase BshC n=1 Tax=Paenibacillus nasutitermitis TaxID=1652958 RepID=A0A916Z288_9BACL|nr:bacillithiol biosynthesis cysteine-adding enzyme BshC [Paenibacillus nasutitermitis]GGD71125.1 putative cysteine ligase BshC [Paenibacillus nasutitermitis]